MGINNLPNMKLYWSNDMVFQNTFISSIMSRNRFLQIFYNLHLANNSLEPERGSKEYSKIYKIKNFTDILRENFKKNYSFGRYGTIDESMIKFKGRSSLKQYLPLKPIKRGYKVWCLCDPITGYLFNFQIYLGKDEISGKEASLSERVVFDLISSDNFQGKYLYFDNFFTSLRLLEKLKLQKIKACGTIRPDRASIPSDFAKKNKMQRGDCESMIILNSIVFVWMDTKQVLLASNYHKENEVVSISRRLKNGQHITINCPKAIKDYNQFSHGVDRLNQRISCYNLDLNSAVKYLVGQELYKDEGIVMSSDWLNKYSNERENFIVNDEDKKVDDNEDIKKESGFDDDVDNWNESDDKPANPAVTETLLNDEIEDQTDVGIKFAPAENNRPTSVLMDMKVDELTFPKIYCGKQRRIKENVKLTYAKIAKSELRMFDRRYGRISKLFFTYKKLQTRKFSDAISITLRKTKNTRNLTATQMLNRDYINGLVHNDDAFTFLRCDRSSPAF
ncbi:unnamed protein product [Adineta ricciae]|uniref:PiggyBac transposable element-derived protein domain-containing protein n=1 Tax=Adineta ricciae TaxID=249248 RepID=A0A815WH61_ADIRI|nr:unnamed protein product [Adineta ricciae]